MIVNVLVLEEILESPTGNESSSKDEKNINSKANGEKQFFD